MIYPIHWTSSCTFCYSLYNSSINRYRVVGDTMSDNTSQYSAEFKSRFEKLSFKDNVDISGYREALDYAFSNPDVKNIAISGPYGSGKSSILATYEKENTNKKIIHISLAHFGSSGNVSEEEKEKLEFSLEGKILNQLIHQVDKKKIPQTNFRFKNALSKEEIRLRTLIAVFFLISIIHLVFSYVWIAFVSTFKDCWFRNLLELSTTPGSFFASGCIGLIIISYCIKSAVTTQRYNYAIRKLSLQGNDIELFEDESGSFFDKYLNEVLYLVEESGIEAIVFEDMDRYNMESIFARLREVNTLANLKLKDRKKVIRFIFLLKDDLFDSKDRTKFFDYIIPVVPVVGSSNSYDQLRTQLQKSGTLNIFDKYFLEGLAIYIDDMRLLINICNEYHIYHHRLEVENNKLSPEKLLALITYKNIFPKDFTQLQSNLGYIHSVFSSKEELIAQSIKELKAEILKKKELIEKTHNEILTQKRDLMYSYAVKCGSAFQYTSHIRSKTDSELDKLIRENLLSNELSEYIRRLNIADRSITQAVNDIHEECNNLEHQIHVIKGRHLYELIPHSEGKEKLKSIPFMEDGAVDEYEELKNNYYFDLLAYLILNGYIDESYPDYISYFYPNSLSRNDKIFVRRVLDRQESEYSYELDDPARVLEKLRVEDFDFPEVLNFSLLDHLLHCNKDSAYLKHLILHLRRTQNYHFVSQYLKVTAENDAFVYAINSLWNSFIHEVITGGHLESHQIRKFTVDTLQNSDDELLDAVNFEGTLCEYIATSPDYLCIEKSDTRKIISAFIHLGVKFHSIDFSVSQPFLYTQVYKHSLYQINMDNINSMLINKLNISDPEQLKERNYTTICTFSSEPLYAYIHQNINPYLEAWLNDTDVIHDEEKCVVSILNNPTIPYEAKEKYVQKISSKISSLKSVTDSTTWKLLMLQRKVICSEENLWVFWMSNRKMDELIIKFINAFKRPINMTILQFSDNKDALKGFFEQIVSAKTIHNDQYRDLVSTIKVDWNYNFSIKNLEHEKVRILIETHIIPMGVSMLQFMRSNYPALLNEYIYININTYSSIMNASQLVHSELIMVLDMDVSDEIKKRLISFTSQPVSIVSKSYSDDVKLHILQTKPDATDFPILYLEYADLSDQLKDFTFKKAISSINSILSGTTQISYALYADLITSTGVSALNKQKLLLVSLRKAASEKDAKAYLLAAGRDEFVKIFSGRLKHSIPKDPQNKDILDVLKANHWIKSYGLNDDSTEYIVERTSTAEKRELVGAK